MKRNMLRYLALSGIALLLAALVVSGCTRSKSSGPAEATAETSATESSETPGAEPSDTPDMSGQEGMDATRTAWANETATAEAPTPGGGEAEPTDTPGATESPEATQPAVTEEPGTTATPEPTEEAGEPAPTQPSGSGEEQIHVVQPGENLFRISLSYGLPYQEVMAYNGITNPNLIYVGQELKIPPSGSGGEPSPPPAGDTGGTRVHVVKPGENLFRVALQYNLPYTVVAEANDLSYPYTIYTGQRLIIP
jgi:LysM repeat protein